MKKYSVIVIFCITASVLSAQESKISAYTEIQQALGFFATYSTFEAGFDFPVSEQLSLGLTQRLSYGYTYKELMGITDIRLYIQRRMYVSLGISYLVTESQQVNEKDFNTPALPVMGIGVLIPIPGISDLYIIPAFEMNQSFSLSENIR